MATEIDWDVLGKEGVEGILLATATSVARTYSGIVQKDDLLQEGALFLAQNADKVGQYLVQEDGARHLNRWLLSRLLDVAKKEARIANRTIPLTALEAIDL
jgi:hypothetical protein